MKVVKFTHILMLVILIVVVVSYFRVPFLYFQQDEILGLGQFTKEGVSRIFSGFGSGKVQHFVPLTMSLSYFVFRFFRLNYPIYNIFGLVFHLTNGFLIYRLALHYLKKKNSALVAALVFFSSNVAAQLVMWPVINLNTISLTFSLLAWIAVLKNKILWVPFLFLGAVFSVEYSTGLILFLPVVMFLSYHKNIEERIIKMFPFGITAFGYSLFRLVPIIVSRGARVGGSTEGGTFSVIKVFNLVTRYIGQLFFGQESILFVSKVIQKISAAPDLGTAYAETTIFPTLSTLLGTCMIAFIVMLYRKFKKKDKNSIIAVLCLIFIVSSSLPFLLVPGGMNLSSVIASRYMYFGLAGAAIFTAYFFDISLKLNGRNTRKAIFLVISLMIVLGTIQNYKRADGLYKQGVLRINILKTIKSKYKSLPDKTVFYTESTRSYYGLPNEDKILPFQSGFGQTLLVHYNETENFPAEFFPGHYLWDILAQGYEEHLGRGFGYFRDADKLFVALEENHLPPESVIAFRWISGPQELLDITEEVRQNIAKQ